MEGKSLFEKSQSLVHIYQNTSDGYLLFYTVKDRLVFFALLNLVARKYGIRILGVCLMPDHFHLLIAHVPIEIQSAFVAELTQRFSRLRNEWYHDSGNLFNHSYGYALKIGRKKMKTAASYLYNNPVEKALCTKAEEYQWNFLAYARNDYPFSERIPLRYASRPLRRTIEYVTYIGKASLPLSYAPLDSITEKLKPDELRMSTDYIIQTFNTIDYDALIGLYKGYKEMLLAFESNTGSEYDIKETITKGSDRAYTYCANLLLRSGKWHDLREILYLPESTRRRLGKELMANTEVTRRQVAKFLRYKEDY